MEGAGAKRLIVQDKVVGGKREMVVLQHQVVLGVNHHIVRGLDVVQKQRALG